MTEIRYGNIVVGFTNREDLNQRNHDNRPLRVLTPNQKHTSRVVTITDSLSVEADGIYTDRKDTPVGVLTADCMPIVMFNQDEVAVIHAGWRGLFDGIIQNALRMFLNKPTNAFIGPSIKVCCYEVGKDFIENLKVSSKYYRIEDGRYYLSLQMVATDILYQNGVRQIYEFEECTACSGKYFSYRKGDFDDRILTYAYIRG